MDQDLVEQFVDNFDHHDPRLGADPDQVYEEMLARCPVAHSDKHGGFWVVSDYENATFVLRKHEHFTTVHTVTIPPGLGNKRPLLPLELDPPDHIRYRSLLAPVFAPARIAALEEKVRRICDDLIDGFIEKGACDLVADLASPLPSIIFVEMMGLPYEDAERFHAWKDTILHGHHDDPEGVRRAAAGEEINSYIGDLIERRKKERQDDIISVLLDAEVDGSKLTDVEVFDMTFLLFLAGLDTVTAAISQCFAFLATHPDHRDQLVADPGIIPSAVEELLRNEALVMSGRTVVNDIELGGAQMKAGDRVLVNTISANRDAKQFPDPQEVRFDREPNRHIAFSVGAHRCVGSHLARLELRVVMEQVHARIPDYRLAPGATIKKYLTSVSGIEALPLVWG